MSIIKRIGYLIFVGLITFAVASAVMGLLNLAIQVPLALLQTISHNQHPPLIFFLSAVILFLTGLLVDTIFKKGLRFGKINLINQVAALTNDGKIVFIMGEIIVENAGQEEAYYKTLRPVSFLPYYGFIDILPKNIVRPLENPPAEILHLLCSNALAEILRLKIKKQ